MAYEMLVGLEVTDETRYHEYRRAMGPILERHGGSFGYDFRVSEVLISRTKEEINRVFTLQFPDREGQERFFSDARYLDVKKRLFEGAVRSTTILAAYTA